MDKTAEVESKLAIGKQKKDAGDTAFKAGDMKGALRAYHEALLWIVGLDKQSLPGVEPPSADTAGKPPKTEVDEVLEKIHANMAQCHIKNENWKRAVESADKALAKNENNYKALFRKAKAQGELGYFEKAEKILEDLLKKNPAESPSYNAELNRLRAIDKKREKVHSQKFKGFLARDKSKQSSGTSDTPEMQPLSSGPVPRGHIEEIVEPEPEAVVEDDD